MIREVTDQQVQRYHNVTSNISCIVLHTADFNHVTTEEEVSVTDGIYTIFLWWMHIYLTECAVLLFDWYQKLSGRGYIPKLELDSLLYSNTEFFLYEEHAHELISGDLHMYYSEGQPYWVNSKSFKTKGGFIYVDTSTIVFHTRPITNYLHWGTNNNKPG